MINFIENAPVSLFLQDLQVLVQKKSNFHDITLFKHKQLGKILIIDDEVHHIEAYAPLYHEPLVHLPTAFIEQLNTVLILGGGSLFAAQECLKYDSIEKVVMVDHDPSVIEIIEKNYKHAKKVLKHPKFFLEISDGISFLNDSQETFDLLLNDCFDLTLNFQGVDSIFKLMESHVNNNGICCDVIYRNIFEKNRNIQTLKKLSKCNKMAFSLIAVPEYPGILHLLTMWGKSRNLSQKLPHSLNSTQKSWIKAGNCPCVYYAPAHLGYYLYLPPYIKKQFSL